MESALCGEFRVWRVSCVVSECVESSVCGEFRVWRVPCVESFVCGACHVW